MDEHLNLFKSYRSRTKDEDKLEYGVEEDNLTRAFIICLKYLQDAGLISEFLKSLGIDKCPIEDLSFDLQNLDDEKALADIQKPECRKILLLISRHETISGEPADINKLIAYLPETDNSKMDSPKTDKLKKQLKHIIKEQKAQRCEEINRELDPDEAQDLLVCLNECRPDGWIYSNEFAILVESKIGGNKQHYAQLFRHLTGSMGFGLKAGAAMKLLTESDSKSETKLLKTTWMKIHGGLVELMKDKLDKNHAVCIEIINQFKEYLAMAGEKMDLLKLNDEMKNESEFAKDQFNLLLSLINDKIKEDKTNLTMNQRGLHGLWTNYCTQEQQNINTEDIPHFTVHMDDKGLECSLVIPSPSEINNYINENNGTFIKKIKDMLEKKEHENMDSLIQRFRIKLINYRILDWHGNRKGDKYYSFELMINFQELFRKSKKDDNYTKFYSMISAWLNEAKPFAKYAKQLEFTFKFDWVNEDKDTPLRKANLELFKDPKKLVNEFVHFMETFSEFLKE